LGPLFAGVTLGGPPPSAEQRAAIAQFANRNGIEIRLEVRDDTLVAIRATITFGGCCGYEAVDVLGRRLSRPRVYTCMDCSDYIPQDDWAYEPEPGVHVRFHTRVNTLAVRWEPALTTDELLDEVEAMIGTPVDKLKRRAGDRIREWLPHQYMLELPYDAARPPAEGRYMPGMHVATHAGAVEEVELDVLGDEPAGTEPAGDEPGGTEPAGDESPPIEKLLRARWGRPHVDAETGTWSWQRAGRVITAQIDSGNAHVTVLAVSEVARQ
ncbi:MAG TPA: hypothetical protein VLT45_31290, partial [Kofleriaceae bacterium]|nr:hypothetical protein [Kofleriaceae bacterium]